MREPVNKYHWDNSEQVFAREKYGERSKQYAFRIPPSPTVKPDVGNKNSANIIIDSLVVRKKDIRHRMAKLGAKLRAEPIDEKLLDEYQDLNEQLRFVSIYKAELTFLRNML